MLHRVGCSHMQGDSVYTVSVVSNQRYIKHIHTYAIYIYIYIIIPYASIYECVSLLSSVWCPICLLI